MHCKGCCGDPARERAGPARSYLYRSSVPVAVPRAPTGGTITMALGWFGNKQVLACCSCPGGRGGKQAGE